MEKVSGFGKVGDYLDSQSYWPGRRLSEYDAFPAISVIPPHIPRYNLVATIPGNYQGRPFLSTNDRLVVVNF